jgi:hypothetical protein
MNSVIIMVRLVYPTVEGVTGSTGGRVPTSYLLGAHAEPTVTKYAFKGGRDHRR